MKRPILVPAISLVLALAAMLAQAQTAELRLHLRYDASYNADFSPAGYQLHDGANNPYAVWVQPDDIHQFSILLELTGATESPEESLSGALVDVVLGTGLSPYGGFSYAAASPIPSFDPNPPGPLGGGPRGLYTINSDQGDQDLLRIAIETDQLAAHGLDPGENELVEVGSFFVTWYSSFLGTSLRLEPSANSPEPWALWVDSTSVAQPAATMFRSINPAGHNNDFNIYFPEPSSFTLAGLAMAGLGWFRQRTGRLEQHCFAAMPGR